ncbi:fmp21p [Lipomyces arxii]|uniref:fmp21p n=1 Tax=Lipomyces arxii TaxID=56418 RepID=UPI0034CDE0E3
MSNKIRTIYHRRLHLIQSPRLIQFARYSDLMKTRPGPPRLPQEEQDEFDRLVQNANEGVFSTPDQHDQPDAIEQQTPPLIEKTTLASVTRTIPEFQGDVNPKTGEVGGPKQDPLRHGDYSFNGRVTDF